LNDHATDLVNDQNYRLRINWKEQNTGAGKNEVPVFAYSYKGGAYTAISTTSSYIKAIASGDAGFNQDDDTTQQLTSGGFDTTNACCSETGECGGTTCDPPQDGYLEAELCFQIVSADVANGDTIDIRCYDKLISVPLAQYDQTPRITVLKVSIVSLEGNIDAQSAVDTASLAKSVTVKLERLQATGDILGDHVLTRTNITLKHLAPLEAVGIIHEPTVTATVGLAGSITAQSVVNAALQIIKRYVGSISAQTSTTGDLSVAAGGVTEQLAGDIAAQSNVATASLFKSVIVQLERLEATGIIKGLHTSTSIRLVADSPLEAVGIIYEPTIIVKIGFRGSINAQSSVGASIQITKRYVGQIDAQSLVNGDLSIAVLVESLAGNIAAQSSVSGTVIGNGKSAEFDDDSNQYGWDDAVTSPITDYPFTFAAWFKPHDITVDHNLISMNKYANTAYYRDCAALYTNQEQKVELWADDYDGLGGSEAIASTTTFTIDDQWHHACGVFVSSTSRAVYLDGGGKNTGSASIAFPPIRIIGLAALGNTFQWGNYMDGLIAHVAIWDVALTDAEILDLSRGARPDRIRPGNLKAYYTLEEKDGYEDQAGSYDLATVNSPTWDLDGPDIRVPLSGNIAAQSSVSGDLSSVGAASFSGNITAQTSVDANLSISYRFAGIVTAQSFVNADLSISGAVSLAGNIAAQASVVGDLSVVGAVSLSGDIVAQSSVDASLQITKRFVGTVNAQSLTVGSLDVTGAVALDASGKINALTSTTADFQIAKRVIGNIVAQSVVGGDLSVTGAVALSGLITAQTTTTATVGIIGLTDLAGNINAVTDVVGQTQITVRFSGIFTSGELPETADIAVIDGEDAGSDPWEFDSIEKNGSNTFELVADAAAHGGYGYRTTYDGVNTKVIGIKSFASQTEVYFRFYIRIKSGFTVTRSGWSFYIFNGLIDLSRHVNLSIGTTGFDPTDWELTGDGISGMSTTTNFSLGDWHYIDLYWKAGTGDGAVKLWIDGDVVSDQSGLNTGAVGLNKLQLGSAIEQGDPTNGDYIDYDDLLVSTTGPLGEYFGGGDAVGGVGVQSSVQSTLTRIEQFNANIIEVKSSVVGAITKKIGLIGNLIPSITNVLGNILRKSGIVGSISAQSDAVGFIQKTARYEGIILVTSSITGVVTERAYTRYLDGAIVVLSDVEGIFTPISRAPAYDYKKGIWDMLTTDSTYLSLLGNPTSLPYQTYYLRSPARPSFPEVVYRMTPGIWSQEQGRNISSANYRVELLVRSRDNSYEDIAKSIIRILNHRQNTRYGFRCIYRRSEEIYDERFNVYGRNLEFDLKVRRAIFARN
jgi:hypothetical protein